MHVPKGIDAHRRDQHGANRPGTAIASPNAMTDDRYFALLIWTICVLSFACSVLALTEHPEWFGA
jgi:hypothetical protein